MFRLSRFRSIPWRPGNAGTQPSIPSVGFRPLLRCSILCLLVVPVLAHAQIGGAYDLSWNVIDCGGGTASGGVLSLFVSFAPPVAGAASGGLYTLQGGFLQPVGSGPSGVGDVANAPAPLVLRGALPNPSPGTCAISYDLPAAVRSLALGVYDAGGRLVRTLSAAPATPGRHELAWDGNDGAGVPARSGLYFVRLRTDRGERSEKLVLLR
jgi:hypothetical protein